MTRKLRQDGIWVPGSETPAEASQSIARGDYEYLLSVHHRPKYALLAGLANGFGVEEPDVLDLGCGYPLLPAFGLQFNRYDAVDHCEDFFKQDKLPESCWPGPLNGIRWVVGDAFAYDPGFCYDVVITAGLSEQIGHKAGFMPQWFAQCGRLARPGGIIIVESCGFPVRGVAVDNPACQDWELITDGVMVLEMVPFHGSNRWWAVWQKRE